jgi:hypothetical protein
MPRKRFLQSFDIQQKYTRQPQSLSLQHGNKVYHLYNAAWYPFGRLISELSMQLRGRYSPLFKEDRVN